MSEEKRINAGSFRKSMSQVISEGKRDEVWRYCINRAALPSGLGDGETALVTQAKDDGK